MAPSEARLPEVVPPPVGQSKACGTEMTDYKNKKRKEKILIIVLNDSTCFSQIVNHIVWKFLVGL